MSESAERAIRFEKLLGIRDCVGRAVLGLDADSFEVPVVDVADANPIDRTGGKGSSTSVAAIDGVTA